MSLIILIIQARETVESSMQEGLVLILSVSKKEKSAVCPHCGTKSRHLHQNQNPARKRFTDGG